MSSPDVKRDLLQEFIKWRKGRYRHERHRGDMFQIHVYNNCRHLWDEIPNNPNLPRREQLVTWVTGWETSHPYDHFI
jgi:hypothetical protein